MKPTKYVHIYCLLPVILLSVILLTTGCGGNASVTGALDIAENLMENSPASALEILDSIDASSLTDESLRARYALLKSIALDKNYIDTTTFDVLQPAIDYYLKNGTPDEKLRTYYYQGRIYQNKNERDSALYSMIKGLEKVEDCKDSLTMARNHVAQAVLYFELYDINRYMNHYEVAANLYRRKSYRDYEFDCLLNVLNGSVTLNNQGKADSLIQILNNNLKFLSEYQNNKFQCYKLSYIEQFGSKEELNNLLINNSKSICSTIDGLLSLASAYNILGDNKRALDLLDFVNESGIDYDTIKYLVKSVKVLKDVGNYKDAFSAYWRYSHMMDSINTLKFEQNAKTVEEKHQVELQAERDARQHAKMMWRLAGGIVVLIVVVVLMLLMINNIRTQKQLAVQKVRTAELENESLKMENRNLQLERDNKVLEAENLAHRVEVLESESENLKELLQSQSEMPAEVRAAIQERIKMLNSYLASQISDHKEFEKSYDKWVENLTADTEKFMDSNRLAFQASHPRFIRYFEEHGLTTAEINYVCLYAIGLRGKDVGNYMKKRSHVNISSAIRKKLGIDQHETNIGIYVRKLLGN